MPASECEAERARRAPRGRVEPRWAHRTLLVPSARVAENFSCCAVIYVLKPSASRPPVAPEALWLTASSMSPELREEERSSSPFSTEPNVTRTSSALQLQRAERTRRDVLARGLEAAVCVQRMMRGWFARMKLKRKWQKAGDAILARRLRHSMGDQSPQSVIEAAPKLVMAPQRLPAAIPLPPPPVRVQQSSEQHASMLNRAKSQMCTLRLLDDATAVGLPDFSPQHFDVCVRESLHDALYESGKRHFAAGHLERALCVSPVASTPLAHCAISACPVHLPITARVIAHSLSCLLSALQLYLPPMFTLQSLPPL